MVMSTQLPLATERLGGDLRPLGKDFTISVPSNGGGPVVIELKILPEVTDTKKASYADTSIIGRSNPIKTYSHSDNRIVTVRLHFLSIKWTDLEENRSNLWAIQSAVYPREGTPYKPPPVCKLRFGSLLGGPVGGGTPTGTDGTVCAVLENYSVSYPTNVAWVPIDTRNMYPVYFQVNTSWHVVYTSTPGSQTNSLPNQDRILKQGQ